ncbi:hypothetical protein [Oricola nitratireducens]|uniref:hypothetical protein n=1 Tax=Oricola nitratireducens TaxID=2775868 RepID=UPI0018665BF1|nr:hypothetical protein [Oricola nitratireducens]
MGKKTELHVRHNTPLLRETVHDWFGSDDYEIEAAVAVFWCGWDADSEILIVRLPDGTRRLVVENPASLGPDDDLAAILEERMRTYMQAAHDTARFLVKWRGRPAPVIRDLTDEEAAAIINGGDEDQDG